MKLLAALVLMLSLALFPLSGQRTVAAQGHEGDIAHVAMAGAPAGHDGPAAQHVHEQRGHGTDAQGLHVDHDHAVPQAHHDLAAAGHHTAPAQADHHGCGSLDGQSSCCSLSCHAMAVQDPLPGVATLSSATRRVALATPLPRGSGGDGLLRPPRTA